MHRLNRFASLALVLLLPVLIAGCQKKEEAPPPVAEAPKPVPFKVTGIELGKALTSDKRVPAPLALFGTRDTIYVAIASEGTAQSTTLSARWLFEDGQLVAQDSQTIAPAGPAQTEFHVSRPGVWPKGKYSVEVLVDGASVGKRDFEVK